MKHILIVFSMLVLIVGCSAKEEQMTPADDNYGVEEVEVNEENSETLEVNEELKGVYMSLEQDKAYEMIQNEEVIIMDVRTAEEYSQGHLKDSNLLPVDMIEAEVLNQFPDKSAVYLVYCRSGNRSKTAVNTMVELGYTNVYDIGGINTWPYEIVQ